MLIEPELFNSFPLNTGGYITFIKYYPTRFNVSNDYRDNRTIVYAFKNGTNIPRVNNCFKIAIKTIKERNEGPFYITPIPASKIERNTRRYFNLCNTLSHESEIQNGYHLLQPIQDRDEVHIGDTRNYDDILGSIKFHEEIANKNIILIDDVVTTGKSFRKISEHLLTLGANMVFGIMLAKTHWLNVTSENEVPETPAEGDDLPF